MTDHIGHLRLNEKEDGNVQRAPVNTRSNEEIVNESSEKLLNKETDNQLVIQNTKEGGFLVTNEQRDFTGQSVSGADGITVKTTVTPMGTTREVTNTEGCILMTDHNISSKIQGKNITHIVTNRSGEMKEYDKIKEKSKQRKEEIARLQKEIDRLQRGNSNLETTRDHLLNENERLLREKTDLETTQDHLVNEKNTLADQLSSCDAKKNELESDIAAKNRYISIMASLGVIIVGILIAIIFAIKLGTKKCTGADVMVLLDTSSSIESSDMEQMKHFTTTLIDSLNVGPEPNRDRIGLIQFSDVANLTFQLNQFSTKSEMNSAVEGISDVTKGQTFTNLALDLMRESGFWESSGARASIEGVPRIGILLTDGYSSEPALTTTAAQKVHDAGITMIVVGVGEKASLSEELEHIASSPWRSNVIQLKDSSDVSGVVKFIEKRSCHGGH